MSETPRPHENQTNSYNPISTLESKYGVNNNFRKISTHIEPKSTENIVNDNLNSLKNNSNLNSTTNLNNVQRNQDLNCLI